MPTLVIPGVSRRNPLRRPPSAAGAVGHHRRRRHRRPAGARTRRRHARPPRSRSLARSGHRGDDAGGHPRPRQRRERGRDLAVSPAARRPRWPSSTRPTTATRRPALLLRCRSNGDVGQSADRRGPGVANSAGSIVRASVRLLQGSRQVEQFADLQVAPGMPDDLFDMINRRSRYVIAIDPGLRRRRARRRAPTPSRPRHRSPCRGRRPGTAADPASRSCRPTASIRSG